MGFLDDIKKGVDNVGSSINSSVSDNQTKSRVTNLLRDLGSLTWLARTGQSGPDDATEIIRIETELADIAATKGALDLSVKTVLAPPPPPPAAPAPPAPPVGAAPAPPAPPADTPFPLDPDAPVPHPDGVGSAAFPLDPDAPAPPPPAPNPPAAPNPPGTTPPTPAGDASFTLDDL